MCVQFVCRELTWPLCSHPHMHLQGFFLRGWICWGWGRGGEGPCLILAQCTLSSSIIVWHGNFDGLP